MPATVATSLRLNRSDAIVITVTESVWCAKPARLSSAIADVRTVDEADERHAHHQQRADRERAAARVDQAARRASAAHMLIVPPNMQPRSAARNGSQANSAICFRSNAAHGGQVERQPERQRAPGRIGEKPRERDAPEVPLARGCVRIDGRLPSPARCALLARERCSRVPAAESAWMRSRRVDRTAARARPRRGRCAPVITNADCQLCVRIAHATSGGASIEPTDAPMLKRPPARPRSLRRETIPPSPSSRPGLAEPSANPSSPRRPTSACQLCARPCAMLMNDQAIAKIANPSFSPTHVEHVAADRLQHDRALERAEDPRVLLRRDVQVLEDASAPRPPSVLRVR